MKENETKKTDAEQSVEATKRAAPKKAAEGGTMVYCGPSVRGVARQYMVYYGAMPETLQAFAEQHKAVKGLIVPLERFAETRRNLEVKGTAETILYQKVKNEL